MTTHRDRTAWLKGGAALCETPPRPTPVRRRLVLLGDPGRSYFPKSGVVKIATYRVETTRELEDREIRDTSVYRLSAT